MKYAQFIHSQATPAPQPPAAAPEGTDTTPPRRAERGRRRGNRGYMPLGTEYIFERGSAPIKTERHAITEDPEWQKISLE